MIDLSRANDQQREAILHGDGPALVLSVAGSGKTYCLTTRAARLIDEGTAPERIMLVTFTNKAAEEMKSRMSALVGDEPASHVWANTCHSHCLRILRTVHGERGESQPQILAGGKQIRFARDILAEPDPKHPNGMGWATDPKLVLSRVSRAKGALRLPSDAGAYFEEHDIDLNGRLPLLLDFWTRYEALKDEQGYWDFDDLLLNVYLMFEAEPAQLARWQGYWDYVMEDEVQDTQKAQHAVIKMLAAGHRNYFAVGDANQCVVEGTLISTPLGPKPVQDVRGGDFITCAIGGNRTGSAIVTDVSQTLRKGNVVRIRTESGKTLTTTPEHIHFASYPPPDGGQRHFVYLMQREDLGFRVGVTSYTPGDSTRYTRRYGLRLNQEQGDAMWLLDVCDDVRAAHYLEQYYSVKYGLPTWIFRGGVASYRDEDIQRLFAALPTEQSARRLLADKDMFIDMPHHRPKCMSVRRRRNFSITLAGDTHRGTTLHRYSIAGSDDSDRGLLTEMGLPVRDAKGCRGWRIESSHKHLGDIYGLLRRIEQSMPVNVIQKAAFASGRNLDLTPASHVLPGMDIFVRDDDGRVTVESVESVERVPYEGNVYDLNVDRFHNFVAEGIVTHNSIFGFRGSDPQNTILGFQRDYPEGKIIKLPINYRSQSAIVEAGAALIRNNPVIEAYSLEPIAHRPEGPPIRTFLSCDEEDEAAQVADQILGHLLDGVRYRDIAVLYRTNAQSRAFEDVFVLRNVPYVVYGSCGFYDRMEIMDILAYLQLAYNPACEAGDEALKRIINIPTSWYQSRGKPETTHYLGKAFIETLERTAHGIGKSMWEALSVLPLKGYQSDGITDVKDYIAAVKYKAPEPAAMIVAARNAGYDAHLMREMGRDENEQEGSRIDNLDQLTYAAQLHENIASFLDFITQQRSRAKALAKDTDAVQLMTIHRSKGLEFPVVKLAGVSMGLLPHKRSVEWHDPDTKKLPKPHSLEEERRLAYVGATRAMDELWISVLARYMDNDLEPSPFVGEMGFEIAGEAVTNEQA